MTVCCFCALEILLLTNKKDTQSGTEKGQEMTFKN